MSDGEMIVRANGIDHWCEWFDGDSDVPGEPLVLVSGVGGQGYDWDDSFCGLLSRSGFRVLRYDLRDCGKSQWLTGLPTVDADAVAGGNLDTVSYFVDDLATDLAGILDALDLQRVHLVGHSLGGMIVQALAIADVRRVSTLTSIASTTGDAAVGRANPHVKDLPQRSVAGGREGEIAVRLQRRRAQSGSGFYFDEQRIRAHIERMYDRGNYPDGRLRHLAAAVCSPDRTAMLARLEVPALVVHGDDDPLIDPSGGFATADALQAEMWPVPGMGHYLEPETFEELAVKIRRLADAAKA